MRIRRPSHVGGPVGRKFPCLGFGISESKTIKFVPVLLQKVNIIAANGVLLDYAISLRLRNRNQQFFVCHFHAFLNKPTMIGPSIKPSTYDQTSSPSPCIIPTVILAITIATTKSSATSAVRCIVFSFVISVLRFYCYHSQHKPRIHRQRRPKFASPHYE